MAIEFKLPEVGEGITSGTIVSVLVKPGDTVEADQGVLELETDKAVVEVPAPQAGVVKEVRVKAGEEAKIGQVVLVLEEAGGGDADADADADGDAAPAKEEAKAASAPAEGAETGEAARAAKEAGRAAGGGDAKADGGSKDDAARRTDEAASSGSTEGAQAAPGPYEGATGERRTLPAAPSVRRLAREKGIDLHHVDGSGILGRISADDVLRFAEGGGRAPATGGAPAAMEAPALPDFGRYGETERVAMSGIRKATVRSMSTAWSSVPMVTQFDKADITEFERLRKRSQAKAEAVGAKITPTAMLLKVVAGALRRFPDFNASIDVRSNEIVYKKYVNVGVAVDTEYGLLVPVIRDADRKNILELAKELGEIAERARARKLSPEEMQGGNFSISNLGGIGGTGFTPIVNPPDVAILGVSRGQMEPVWNAETGEFAPRMMMPLCVTYDHRLIDGAQAARFLRWVCQAIEDPFLLSLEG